MKQLAVEQAVFILLKVPVHPQNFCLTNFTFHNLFLNIYNNPYLALKLAGECAIIRRTWRDVKIMLIYL